jgi:hypothetical protein
MKKKIFEALEDLFKLCHDKLIDVAITNRVECFCGTTHKISCWAWRECKNKIWPRWNLKFLDVEDERGTFHGEISATFYAIERLIAGRLGLPPEDSATEVVFKKLAVLSFLKRSCREQLEALRNEIMNYKIQLDNREDVIELLSHDRYIKEFMCSDIQRGTWFGRVVTILKQESPLAFGDYKEGVITVYFSNITGEENVVSRIVGKDLVCNWDRRLRYIARIDFDIDVTAMVCHINRRVQLCDKEFSYSDFKNTKWLVE